MASFNHSDHHWWWPWSSTLPPHGTCLFWTQFSWFLSWVGIYNICICDVLLGLSFSFSFFFFFGVTFIYTRLIISHQNNIKIAFYNNERDAVRHIENILTHFCMHNRETIILHLKLFFLGYFTTTRLYLIGFCDTLFL